MQCPVCVEVQLVMSDRQGIEIDYCPTCRGVWLDRGELDKIIERSTVSSPPRHREERPQRESHVERPRHEYDDDDDYRKKKKRGFLGDLFDFD